MNPKKVGIIRGSNTEYYDASIKDGAELILNIYNHLDTKWKPVDIFIDKENVWHKDGIPLAHSRSTLESIDAFWDTTRSDAYLEVGNKKIINVNGGFTSFIKKDDKQQIEHFKNLGVEVLKHIIISPYLENIDISIEKYSTQKALDVLRKISPPWKIKKFPTIKGENQILVKTFPNLIEVIRDFAIKKKSILIEEYVRGDEVLFHTLSGFREKETFIFPYVPADDIGYIRERNKKEMLESVAKKIHNYLPATNYVNTKLILDSKNQIFLSDFDFCPDFQETSHFTKSCEIVGEHPKNILLYLLENRVK